MRRNWVEIECWRAVGCWLCSSLLCCVRTVCLCRIALVERKIGLNIRAILVIIFGFHSAKNLNTEVARVSRHGLLPLSWSSDMLIIYAITDFFQRKKSILKHFPWVRRVGSSSTGSVLVWVGELSWTDPVGVKFWLVCSVVCSSVSTKLVGIVVSCSEAAVAKSSRWKTFVG